MFFGVVFVLYFLHLSAGLKFNIGNSMICSDIWYKYHEDISNLLYVISRAVRRVKFVTILKYHEWYLCQISCTKGL